MLSPLVAIWLLIAILLIFSRPRAQVLTVFLLSCFSIPIGQVVVLAGLHFTVLRILILTVLARMAASRQSPGACRFAGGFNAIDRAVVLWTVSAVIVISLQWMEAAALINALGSFVDAFGGYLAVRFLIPDREALRRTVKVLALVCVVQGACMINEQITHLNVFGYLGGASLGVTVRDGKIRSEGVIGCINGGALAGVWIPMFIWLWSERRSRVFASAGLAGALAMVITSNSSTSWMAVAGALVGLAFWPLRNSMRLVRWAFALTLVALHMVMHGPVWSLIARIDLTGSSSSYHRYYLLDNCIRHFDQWWFLGYRHYDDWGWSMWDLCNQFVAVAVTGGLLTLVFYILVFKRSFAAIGIARKQVQRDRSQEWLFWCLGSVLFAIVVAHFGINYMAQAMMGVFPLLSCISVAGFEVARRVTLKTETPVWDRFDSVAQWHDFSPARNELVRSTY